MQKIKNSFFIFLLTAAVGLSFLTDGGIGILAQAKDSTSVQDSPSLRVPILVYHYVRDKVYSRDIQRYEMNVPPAVFESQLQTLIADGYHFVTMAQVSAALDGTFSLPEKPIVLTFDDGIVDFYTDVLPLLNKYQAKATAYLVTSLFNHKNYLTTDMVSELAKSDRVEIGSHTLHHPKLNLQWETKAKKEIEESKASLEKSFGISVTTFAYPFGLRTKKVIQIVQDAGYQTAVSLAWGTKVSQANRYSLYRLNAGVRTGKSLLSFLRAY